MNSEMPARALSGVARRTAVARVPALSTPSASAAKQFLEFFAAQMRNSSTRRAYFHAVLEYLG